MKEKGTISKTIFEVVSVAVSAIVTIILIFTFGFRVVTVDGQSMVPTLDHQDVLLAVTSKTSFDYGDIIIVVQPGQLNKSLIKRVIATEGQWIDINYATGDVSVGETPDAMVTLDEPYIAELTTQRPYSDKHVYPVQVPEGYVFAMGDNRNDSIDSRSEYVGFVDEQYILGKAVVRVKTQANGIDPSAFDIYYNFGG